jgi:hypothetical protein
MVDGSMGVVPGPNLIVEGSIGVVPGPKLTVATDLMVDGSMGVVPGPAKAAVAHTNRVKALIVVAETHTFFIAKISC